MNEKPDQNMQITIDASKIEPVYSNFANISHQPFDFTLDFMRVSPPRGDMVGRVMMSPQHAKAFLAALTENIAKYEQTFGPIPGPPDPSTVKGPHIGFAN
jgi:hypothetical protein